MCSLHYMNIMNGDYHMKNIGCPLTPFLTKQNVFGGGEGGGVAACASRLIARWHRF